VLGERLLLPPRWREEARSFEAIALMCLRIEFVFIYDAARETKILYTYFA
jgi:hypothetical protein